MRSRSLSAIANIEGRLAISTDKSIFFMEDGILLLELGIDLANWLGALKIGQTVDFKYVTIDHDSSEPIILFLTRNDNLFEIDSPWKLVDETAIVDSDGLVAAVELFLNDLKQGIMNAYGVNLLDYLDR